MKVRKLDLNHDWQFGKGQNDYAQGNEAIAQDAYTRLGCFLGDCFFDLGAGIDWFNLLGGKDQVALDLRLRAVLLNTAGITGIARLSIALDSNRNITIKYKALTIYSTVEGTFFFSPTDVSKIVQEQNGFLLL